MSRNIGWPHLLLAALILAYIIMGGPWSLKEGPRQFELVLPLEPRCVDGRRFAGRFAFVQIGLGALVAGLHAGLTHNTWPLMDGRLYTRRTV